MRLGQVKGRTEMKCVSLHQQASDFLDVTNPLRLQGIVCHRLDPRLNPLSLARERRTRSAGEG